MALTKASFGEFVTQYEKLVYTVCFQLTQDATAAEDLTQDTFLAAYLHLDSCPANYEKPWLIRIASNKAKDFLQSAYMRYTLLPGDEGMPPELPVPSSEELVIDRSEEDAIRDLILSLREPYKSVCSLHLLQEKTTEETASILGRPVKTVHTQISRAKLMLREQLERRAGHANIQR